jgi:hypothetical protein
MTDIAHYFGNDLAVGATGDLALATGDIEVQQRVLRRLLTATGDYLWQLNYGAGLGAMVGRPMNAQRIAAIIRTQILQEATVAPQPPPTVDVTGGPDGTVTATVAYTDAPTGNPVLLTFPIG